MTFLFYVFWYFIIYISNKNSVSSFYVYWIFDFINIYILSKLLDYIYYVTSIGLVPKSGSSLPKGSFHLLWPWPWSESKCLWIVCAVVYVPLVVVDCFWLVAGFNDRNVTYELIWHSFTERTEWRKIIFLISHPMIWSLGLSSPLSWLILSVYVAVSHDYPQMVWLFLVKAIGPSVGCAICLIQMIFSTNFFWKSPFLPNKLAWPWWFFLVL